MLKKVTVFLLLVLGTFIFTSPVLAQGPTYSYVKEINLQIGEQAATINDIPTTLDQPAYVKDGRTLVPFRFLGEALGATVTWDDTNKMASLKLNGSEVNVTIGSIKASVNNVESALDVPAEVKEGRTFVPLRFVSEALGASVDYDDETKTVTVTVVNTDGWEKYVSDGVTFNYPKDWTISGDINTGLSVRSPLGTDVSVQKVQNETSEILDQEKALHDNDGFQLINEGLVDDSDPNSGQMVLFMKPVLSNMDDSDIIAVIVDNNFILKFTSKYSNFVDLSVADKIFQEIN